MVRNIHMAAGGRTMRLSALRISSAPNTCHTVDSAQHSGTSRAPLGVFIFHRHSLGFSQPNENYATTSRRLSRTQFLGHLYNFSFHRVILRHAPVLSLLRTRQVSRYVLITPRRTAIELCIRAENGNRKVTPCV